MPIPWGGTQKHDHPRRKNPNRPGPRRAGRVNLFDLHPVPSLLLGARWCGHRGERRRAAGCSVVERRLWSADANGRTFFPSSDAVLRGSARLPHARVAVRRAGREQLHRPGAPGAVGRDTERRCWWTLEDLTDSRTRSRRTTRSSSRSCRSRGTTCAPAADSQRIRRRARGRMRRGINEEGRGFLRRS